MAKPTITAVRAGATVALAALAAGLLTIGHMRALATTQAPRTSRRARSPGYRRSSFPSRGQ